MTTPDWRKEENYFKDSEGKIAIHTERGNIGLPEYISGLLSSDRARLREEVEKLKNMNEEDFSYDMKAEKIGYIFAIDNVLSLLNTHNEELK